MIYKVKKNSVSNYPMPVINACVLCYLNEADTSNEIYAKFWIPFTINLSECEGKTLEEIDDIIRTKGQELFESESNQAVMRAIEVGVNINAPEVL